MDITRGRELQERIGLDALTLLVLFGDSISTEMHEHGWKDMGHPGRGDIGMAGCHCERAQLCRERLP